MQVQTSAEMSVGFGVVTQLTEACAVSVTFLEGMLPGVVQVSGTFGFVGNLAFSVAGTVLNIDLSNTGISFGPGSLFRFTISQIKYPSTT
jgi:hypothetical protein